MELHFKKTGEGVPVIILHGLYGSSDNWFSFARDLASEGHEVFLPDARNHGDSPHADEHTYDAMSEDLFNFMKQHHIDKANLIGHSMGGKTAIHFALKYPGKLSSLIVVDISPGTYHENKRRGSALPTHQEILDALDGMDLSSVHTRKEADEYLAGTIHSERIRQFLLKNLKRESKDAFSWGLNVSALKKELPRILEGFDLPGKRPEKEVTGFPVVFIRGSESPYIQDEDRELIKEIFPAARIETVPGAGHWIHAEKPEALMDLVTRYINR